MEIGLHPSDIVVSHLRNVEWKWSTSSLARRLSKRFIRSESRVTRGSHFCLRNKCTRLVSVYVTELSSRIISVDWSIGVHFLRKLRFRVYVFRLPPQQCANEPWRSTWRLDQRPARSLCVGRRIYGCTLPLWLRIPSLVSWSSFHHFPAFLTISAQDLNSLLF